jgi:UDP-N-acetylglucosamine:LPS N-acetylglucosamine transferase
VKKIDFLYFDAGGGHRAAATALKAVSEQQQQRPWEVRLVNIQEVLHSLDVFRKITGIRLEDIYNLMLAKGWTLGSAQGLRFMQMVIRMNYRPVFKLLAQHWKDTQPDLVVSVVPNFNRVLFDSLRSALPRVPYVTILTDLADYPPHFWIEPNQDQYFICGTDKATAQARAQGYPAERVLQTSGMILRPMFYEPVAVDRDAERRRLGLDPNKPVGLVLFGGQGSKAMLEIAERLSGTQLILICGRNEKLAAELRKLPSRAPHFVEGFTPEVPKYMHVSDFFIGKPGPGSISEAAAMGLPVIVERNAWTLPQERYNADWVREKGIGAVVSNFRDISGAVDELLRNLARFQAAAKSIDNRAIFEIPEILEKILESSAALK